MPSIEEALSSVGLAVETPYRMPLLNPGTTVPLRDAEGKAAYVDVYSSDSAVARRYVRERERVVFKAAGKYRLTPENNEADKVDLLVALTAGWYILNTDGEPIGLDFSPDAARQLYGFGPAAWIRTQVEDAVNDRGNFMRPSSPNSLNGPSTSSARTGKL